jgi:hypothetical protein
VRASVVEAQVHDFRRSRRGAANAAPRPAGVPRGDYVGDGKHGRPFVGQKFGAANRGRVLSEAEKRAVERQLRERGML